MMIVRLLHENWSSNTMLCLDRSVHLCYGPYGVEVQRRKAPNPSSSQSDAAILLSHLGKSYGAHVSLLVVDFPLIFPNAGEVMGCVAGRCGILSTSGLELETVKREALHEVGHLLGLDHCDSSCLMAFSASKEHARSKPTDLCQGCKDRLEELLGISSHKPLKGL